ncbi:MAG: apolipoprotein N-acyltransferase, partial [Myxococcales bacterium]|nr:apolipoprotein N-acyltransferase [Myxococcales bacterium]
MHPRPAVAPSELGLRATAGLVAAAAVLGVAAYPPLGAGALAFVMLAPVVAALEGRSPRAGFAIVYVYTVAMALGVVRWLVHPLVVGYGVSAPAAWTFTALLVAAYATIPSAAAAAYCWLRPHLRPALAPVVFAALSTLAEWLRAEPLRLPWLLAAHPLAFHPIALQAADLGGAHAVGFGVVLANAGLGVALRGRRVAPLVIPALVLAAAGGYGAVQLTRPTANGDAMRLAVVQAALEPSERFRPDSVSVSHHMALTRDFVAREPVDLVIWSETSVDAVLGETLEGVLSRFVDETGVPLLTGALRFAQGRTFNATVLLVPGAGWVESYDKQALVPFSESDTALSPLVEPLLGPVMAGDPYEPGREATVLRGAGIPLATPICFEITDAALVRRFRKRGAGVLINLSNDAWFGSSGY